MAHVVERATKDWLTFSFKICVPVLSKEKAQYCIGHTSTGMHLANWCHNGIRH